MSSIFLLLVLEKTLHVTEACQDDQVQVRLLISLSKEFVVFLSQKSLNHCKSILIFLTVTYTVYNKIFNHGLESSS